jgi:hypothetical protein
MVGNSKQIVLGFSNAVGILQVLAQIQITGKQSSKAMSITP